MTDPKRLSVERIEYLKSNAGGINIVDVEEWNALCDAALRDAEPAPAGLPEEPKRWVIRHGYNKMEEPEKGTEQTRYVLASDYDALLAYATRPAPAGLPEEPESYFPSDCGLMLPCNHPKGVIGGWIQTYHYNALRRYATDSAYVRVPREPTEWILVAERLPDAQKSNYTEVIGYAKHYTYFPIVCIVSYWHKEKTWTTIANNMEDISVEVTHWMPLPEPPKAMLAASGEGK